MRKEKGDNSAGSRQRKTPTSLAPVGFLEALVKPNSGEATYSSGDISNIT